MKARFILPVLFVALLALGAASTRPLGLAKGVHITLASSEYQSHAPIPCDGTPHTITNYEGNWPVIIGKVWADRPGDATATVRVLSYILHRVGTPGSKVRITGSPTQTLYTEWFERPDPDGETWSFTYDVGDGSATCVINVSEG